MFYLTKTMVPKTKVLSFEDNILGGQVDETVQIPYIILF